MYSGRRPDCNAVSSMPAIRWAGSQHSAAANDTPASGPSPRAYALNANSTSASTRHGGGSLRASSAHNDSGLGGVLADRESIKGVADLQVGQRATQRGQLRVAQRLPVGNPGGGGHGVLDVAAAGAVRVRAMGRLPGRRAVLECGGQFRAVGPLVDGDDGL